MQCRRRRIQCAQGRLQIRCIVHTPGCSVGTAEKRPVRYTVAAQVGSGRLAGRCLRERGLLEGSNADKFIIGSARAVVSSGLSALFSGCAVFDHTPRWPPPFSAKTR
ncbi:hypothetical protein ALQ79_04740 [Pseudomonas amygdali pv. lachrymans]|nr:hypothetical protein ALQ79_04740 [Pseudomonas amygdali pv. lachrymans]